MPAVRTWVQTEIPSKGSKIGVGSGLSILFRRGRLPCHHTWPRVQREAKLVWFPEERSVNTHQDTSQMAASEADGKISCARRGILVRGSSPLSLSLSPISLYLPLLSLVTQTIVTSKSQIASTCNRNAK